MNYIKIMNMIILTISYYIMAKKRISKKIIIQILYGISVFLAVFLIDTFVASFEILITYIQCFITIVFIKKNNETWRKAIYYGVSIITFFQIIISFFGSVILLIEPSFLAQDSYLYNIFFQLLMITSSFYVRLTGKMDYEYMNESLLKLDMVYRIVFLLFINILLPSLFSTVDSKKYAMISLVFIIVTLLMELHKNNAIKHENEINQTKTDKQALTSNAILINRKYEEVIKLKHYYSKLYRGLKCLIDQNDFQGIKNYVESYITPINKNMALNDKWYKMVENIHLPTIKALIIETINKSEDIEMISLELRIDSDLNKLPIDEVDLFFMLSIFIENALEELEAQRKSKKEKLFLLISIYELNNAIGIEIVNSLFGMSQRKENSHGMGIILAKQLMTKYSNLNIQTNVKDNCFIQTIHIELFYT